MMMRMTMTPILHAKGRTARGDRISTGRRREETEARLRIEELRAGNKERRERSGSAPDLRRTAQKAAEGMRKGTESRALSKEASGKEKYGEDQNCPYPGL